MSTLNLGDRSRRLMKGSRNSPYIYTHVFSVYNMDIFLYTFTMYIYKYISIKRINKSVCPQKLIAK